MSAELAQTFDVFLSHSHGDAEIVERLGMKLEDEAQLQVWLDKWILVPGEHWQQEMARGLDQEPRPAPFVLDATHPRGGSVRKSNEP
jgi:hypothetical protein